MAAKHLQSLPAGWLAGWLAGKNNGRYIFQSQCRCPHLPGCTSGRRAHTLHLRLCAGSCESSDGCPRHREAGEGGSILMDHMILHGDVMAHTRMIQRAESRVPGWAHEPMQSFSGGIGHPLSAKHSGLEASNNKPTF